MSTLPENEFDLEKLFLPAWAQAEPSATKYANYEGETARDDRRDDRRGPRPPRRDRPPGQRKEFRPGGERRGPPRRDGERPQGRGGERTDFRREGRRGEPRGRRLPPPAPLPEIEVSFLPDEKGVESLARQIKMAGRAYPLFDIAQMVLQKPERHEVLFNVRKNAEGQVIQPLFICALDDTLWLSEEEAISHVLKKHFATFYLAERTATEPPKGKYTFVAQCGMSGIVLGPPNYHDYQNQLRKLHAERFSRMPFEAFKARVKIVRDEEVVKKWIDDQSWKTEYVCLNLPEPVRLDSMEKVEAHFRQTHKENIIKQVESHKQSGVAARALRSPEVSRLLRSVWEDQRRFPLQIATALSQQFAGHGLQFFKVNKTVTHVSVARPHYLDLAAIPVSEGVKRIVDYINANPKCNRRKLVEALAPSPARPIVVVPAAETASAPAPEGAANAAPPEAAPTPEQTAVVSDLHWLIHQGHVIEFHNGTLETAKKPLPKPPRPEKTAAPQAQPGELAAPGEPQQQDHAQAEAQVTPSPEPSPAIETPAADQSAELAAQNPSQSPESPESTGVETTKAPVSPDEPPPGPVEAATPGVTEEHPIS